MGHGNLFRLGVVLRKKYVGNSYSMQVHHSTCIFGFLFLNRLV